MSRSVSIRHAVVDASAVVDLLLRTRKAVLLAGVLDNPHIDLHTPGLCDLEVTAAIRTALRRGRLNSARDAALVVDDLVGLPIERYDHGPLLHRVIELRDNFSAYDASYVALAEALGASLLTADARLAAAARKHTAVDVHSTLAAG